MSRQYFLGGAEADFYSPVFVTDVETAVFYLLEAFINRPGVNELEQFAISQLWLKDYFNLFDPLYQSMVWTLFGLLHI